MKSRWAIQQVRVRRPWLKQCLSQVLDHIPAEKLAGHYHDTNHHAIENIEVSLEKGIKRFDSSIGGIGGCPYAPGAKGNVATSDVVNLLNAKHIECGIDEHKLNKALAFVRTLFESKSG